MFGRKKHLIKKIWRFRKDSKEATESETDNCKALLHQTLKTLNEGELYVLYKSLQSRGGFDTPCLCLGESTFKKQERRKIEAKFIIAKSFLYPELQNVSTLRTLDCCASFGNENSAHCLNPYHYSHVIDLGKF